jgi:hypothetical protein
MIKTEIQIMTKIITINLQTIILIITTITTYHKPIGQVINLLIETNKLKATNKIKIIIIIINIFIPLE